MTHQEQQSAILIFLKSRDFLKLGQAVNHQRWQAAGMTVQRMQRTVQELGLTTFERQLAGIKQCIIRREAEQAKDLLALVVAKRVQLLKQYDNRSELDNN